jgi:hypothetical protein
MTPDFARRRPRSTVAAVSGGAVSGGAVSGGAVSGGVLPRAGSQVPPYRRDTPVQVGRRPRVVDHDVGDRQPLLACRLGGHPGACLILGKPAPGEPLDLKLGGHVHHDDDVEVGRALPLGEQRYVVHHDRVLAAVAYRGLFLRQDVPQDQRVRDGVEPEPCGLVGEHDSGQLRPVKRPVIAQHTRPEGLRDPGEARRSRLNDGPGRRVAVEHHRPERGESPRHRALARPDTARQPDPQHDPPRWPVRSSRAVGGSLTAGGSLAAGGSWVTLRRRCPAVCAAGLLPRGYMYRRVTAAGMSSRWPAQASVTPPLVTAVTLHRTAPILPLDPPKFAEYDWLSSVTAHALPPGSTANTWLVPVSTPISVTAMLAVLQARAATWKQLSAPLSADRIRVAALSPWVDTRPQVALGSAPAGVPVAVFVGVGRAVGVPGAVFVGVGWPPGPGVVDCELVAQPASVTTAAAASAASSVAIPVLVPVAMRTWCLPRFMRWLLP